MSKSSNKKLLLYLGLLVVALPLIAAGCLYYVVKNNFDKAVVETEEKILRDELKRMRASIEQYSRDKGFPPKSLDDLVASGYLQQIPIDPVTNKREWQVEFGDYESRSAKPVKGILDVHSWSGRMSSVGTPYSQW